MSNLTSQTADLFDKTESQLEAIYNEIGLLSKKSPDGQINLFKLDLINEVLIVSNTFLVGKYQPLSGFDKFDKEALPSSSDIVFILSQYLRAMDEFRYDHTKIQSLDCYWILKNGKVGSKTKRSKLMFQRT
jgi:hypothetical protein